MTGTRVLAAIAAIAILCAGSVAGANPDFERGQKLLENLEYRAAAAAFNKALESGGNDPATTAAIHLRLGEIAASTGDTDEAIEHFSRALSIDMALELPEGTSPKVGKPFADARRGIEDPIAATVAVDRSDAVAATLEIANDGLQMAVAASVTYSVGGDTTTAGLKVSGARTPVPLPARTTALEIALLDRHDNRIVELEPVALESETPPSGPEKGATDGATGGSVSASPSSGPFITRWYLWGGLAVAAAATGVGFGLASRSALDELDELKMMSSEVEGSEALALEDKARDRALYANISFAAAGAFAIAATVFVFTGGDDQPAEDTLSVTPALGPDSVGVVSTVRW